MLCRLLRISLFLACIGNGTCDYAFPQSARVVKGNDVMFRFPDSYPDMKTCSVRTPSPDSVWHVLWGPGAEVNAAVEYWGDNKVTCGARIRNISQETAGMWILNVTRPTSELRALYTLEVIEMNVSDGLSQQVLSGSTLTLSVGDPAHDYCDMRRPSGDSPSQLFSGRCEIVVNETTTADSGNWSALVGVSGNVPEVFVQGNVDVYSIALMVGYVTSVTSPGGLNLYCNFPRIKQLRFCRFVRPDGSGFRIEDGVGNGRYSYFGQGLSHGDCGLTIENPEDLDYGLWRCMMRFEVDDYGKDTTESTILVAREEGSRVAKRSVKDTLGDEEFQPNIWVCLGTAVLIKFSSATSLQYCSLLSPSGALYTGMPTMYNTGACALTIPNVTTAHDGTWQCQMGSLQGGFETQAVMHLHVTESPLVAVERNTSSVLGEEATLLCRTLAQLQSNSSSDAMKRPAIKYCRFRRPDGVGFAVGGDSAPGDRYRYYGEGLSRGDCGLNITSVSVQDRGVWKCLVQLDVLEKTPVEFSDTLSLKATDSAVVFPSWILVKQSDDIILQMMMTEADQSRCSVVFPDGHLVDLGSGVEDPAVSYWGAGVDRGECGVRINTRAVQISLEYKQWTLISEDSEGNTKEGTSWVAVEYSSELRRRDTPTTTTIPAKLGGTLDIDCAPPGTPSNTYCVVLPPGADRSHIVPGSTCSSHVDSVTQAHFGEWTCITGRPDEVDEDVQYYNVVSNEATLSVDWRRIDQSNVEIVCRITRPIDFCRFLTPNGQGMRLGDGLAKNRYSYAGYGVNKGDCGVRISDIASEDYGTWKCFLGIGKDIRIGYKTVTKDRDLIIPWMATGEKAVTVRGSRLVIGCRTNATLCYCWLRHPNGTTFTPIEEACSENSTFCYQGAGLQAGECGLTVTRATNQDSGEWSCHMGVLDGGEVVSNVEAYVSDTPLMAETTEVEIVRGSSVTLKCHTVPPGMALDYCRFVRSDGFGFHPSPLEQTEAGSSYSYAGLGLAKGECGLFIEKVTSQDEGTWECAAKVKGEKTEIRDSLTLNVKVLSAASIGGITIGSLLVVGVLVFGVVWTVRRSRQQPRDSEVSDTSSNSGTEDTVLRVIRRPTSYGSGEPATPEVVAVISSEML